MKTKDVLARFKGSFLEYSAHDVLFKCVLFANNEAGCWTIKDMESSSVLVYTDDVLQCLYFIAYKTGK